MVVRTLNVKVVGVVLAVVLAFSFGLVVAPQLRHGVSHVNANVYITQNVGGISSDVLAGNVITTTGGAWVRDFLSGGEAGATNATKYISLSNDATPAAAWTKLANEVHASGFERATGTVTTWTSGGDYGYNVSKTFTASGDVTLQCAGLQWSGGWESDNNLFACAAFTQTTFASSDTLTITWVITVDIT